MRKNPEQTRVAHIVLTESLYDQLREHEVITKWNMSLTIREALKEYFRKNDIKPNRSEQDNGKG